MAIDSDNRPTTRNKAPAPRTTPRQTGSRVWTHVQLNRFLLGIAVLLSAFIGLVLFLFVLLDLPDLRTVAAYRPNMTSLVLDRHGQVVERFFEENRLVVPLREMPPLLPKAFVAAEDARFYQHPGVDAWSVFRALLHNIRAGARAQGGSTITQQVTRDLLLTRKKLYTRKLKEAILAYRLDANLSKDDILHIYLNQIYLGEQAFGVAAAAETYFGKKIGELDLAEIAVLAGLPQAPSRYSPFKNMALAKKRQAYVLNRMAEDGYISAVAAQQAYARSLRLAAPDRIEVNGYFVQQIRNILTEKYGWQRLATGGLTIHTTLDSRLQAAAAAVLAEGLTARSEPGRGDQQRQGALLAMETGTGRVRAVTGGRSFAASQFDRAIQARRQPGSAMKPFVYAAALESGLTPETIIEDSPLTLPGQGNGQAWEPRNFDGRFRGPMTLREALVQSNNIVTIKLLQQVGIGRVVALAKRCGISSPLSADLSLALGSSGLSLLELTAAYAVFANDGRYLAPVFVDKVVDRDGVVLEENRPRARTAISVAAARQISRLLAEVITNGTGREAGGLPVAASGKTGTTDDNIDAWFVGYTPGLAVGVWIGYDRQKSMGQEATGGHVAAPIWREFMRRAIRN